jgi:hypothetical protein
MVKDFKVDHLIFVDFDAKRNLNKGEYKWMNG